MEAVNAERANALQIGAGPRVNVLREPIHVSLKMGYVCSALWLYGVWCGQNAIISENLQWERPLCLWSLRM